MDNINMQASENISDTYGVTTVRKSRQLNHHESSTALDKHIGQMRFAGTRKSIVVDTLPKIREDIEINLPQMSSEEFLRDMLDRHKP